jgi:hypothetical protein
MTESGRIESSGMKTGSTESWRAVADVLGYDSSHHPAQSGPRHPSLPQNSPSHGSNSLVQIFPRASDRLSILEALRAAEVAVNQSQLESGREIHAALAGVLNQLSVFESIRRCPILAITGLLNAGKSSLLATYLSPSNRARVLRGQANNAGTHRFVLWLPAMWRAEAEMLNVLVTFLTSVCGHPPEELADDPVIAAMQYNGRVLSDALLHPLRDPEIHSESEPGRQVELRVDPLGVPLIAYDSGLDRLRVGLVDCPDIQTGFLDAVPSIARDEAQWQASASALRDESQEFRQGERLPGQRLSHLQRVGRICSAFIVVSKLSSLHDESLFKILMTLRDAVPGVPRFLAVNKVKSRYSPVTVMEESRSLVERFGISRVYAAYDYRSALADRWSPPAPQGMECDEHEQLPIFFAPDLRADANRGMESSGYLFELGQQLDVGTLARESNRSLNVQLRRHVLSAIEWLEQNQRMRREKLVDAWRAVAAACFEVMAERDQYGAAVGLRLQASPAIISQLADSLLRTAPLWMQPSLWLDRSVRQLQRAIADSAARLKIMQSASDAVANLTKRFRRGEGASVLTDEKLAESIRSFDRHDALSSVGARFMIEACNVAMSRFAAEDKTSLDIQELDRWSREVWQQMSFRDKLRRGTQPIAVMMAPLLAVILIPIDAGGTTVLVFASAKELLAAAGIATLLAPVATGSEAVGIVQRETPWRQLSDLFAIVCDALGLPRPLPEQQPRLQYEGASRQLSSSSQEIKINFERVAYYDWQLPPDALDSIQLRLQQLDS